MQPETKIQKIKRYLRTRWKELTFALLATIAAAVIGYALLFQHFFVGSKQTDLKKAEPTTKASPLTGEEVDIPLADRAVTGVMVENSPDARPQSGVISAGVVFEAVAEGGITRYLTLFQEARPANLGPVRSLRPYYLDWVMGYDAAIGHVGGSADALALVGQRNAKDLDQFKYGTEAYWRTGDRVAPHNVYTNFDKLDALSARLGYTSSKFEPYKRKKDSPVIPATNTSLTFDFSGALYTTNWAYEPTANAYLRSVAGTPDKDADSGVQLSAKNVIYIPMPTTYDGKYAVMQTIGSGDAVLFRDGVAVPIKWSKAAYNTMLELKNADGTPAELNVGKTWFQIVPAGRTVSY